MVTKKTIIVTGGAQGIGKCISQYLLEAGEQVAIADIDTEAAAECLQQFSRHAESLLFVKTDVSKETSVRECIASVVERFQRLDALINNAGIAQPHSGPVENLSLEKWQEIIQTNLTGCFLMSKHAIPHLRSCKGAIVNIASTRAFQSEKNTEAYSASKGGIVALTHALAISLGPDIRVNCISPGWIEVSAWRKLKLATRPQLREIDHLQHPGGRVGKPEDVACLVKYLISDAAEFITGENFIIDGGMSKKMIYL